MKKIIAVLAMLVVGMAACSKTDKIATPVIANEPTVVETYEAILQNSDLRYGNCECWY